MITDKDNNDPENYTVTIPAEIAVRWGETEAKAAHYTVNSQLKLGAKLKVSAAAENEGKMTNAATDKFLTFTVAGGDVTEYPELNKNVESATTVTIADFNAPIAEYVGHMLYTVEYVAA